MRRSAIFALAFFAAAASAFAQTAVHSTGTSEDGVRLESRVTTYSAPASVLSVDACSPNATTLCLNGGRFQARAIFSAPSLGLTNAPAQAVALTGDTGYFWFFSANNVEITLKVVDGRAFNGFFWAFYAALSDVAYTITITDTETGIVKTYSNSQGSLASVADVTAFGGTGPACTYTVTPSSRSIGSGGGTGTFSVATAAGCSWTATSNVAFLTIVSGSSGTGSGTVTFSIPANGSTSVRTGTLTIAGQLVSVEQAGTSSGGADLNGNWNGTTSQGRPVSFVIVNNRLTTFSIGYAVTGGACNASGTSTVTYNNPPTVGLNGFVVAVTGVGNPRLSFNATVNFNSTSSAAGNVSFTFTQTAPLPACNATGSATYTLTKS